MRETPEQRFARLYMPEPMSGCWLWIGGVVNKRKPYGRISVDGQTVRAHRYSYELHNGPIHDDLWVLHKCDNPSCVNPDHLFLGTVQDNHDDMTAKGRRARRGTHGSAKLTEEQVAYIRSHPGIVKPLAEMFGVDRTTITSVRKGEYWPSLPEQKAGS